MKYIITIEDIKAIKNMSLRPIYRGIIRLDMPLSPTTWYWSNMLYLKTIYNN